MHQPKEWVLDILWKNVYDTKAEGVNLCVFSGHGMPHTGFCIAD